MGLFDGQDRSHSHNRSHSYTEGRSSSFYGKSARGHSPARSASRGYYARPSANRSTSSFFGNFGGSSSRGWGGTGGSSYYKRSPRQGYISYLMHKLQRMVRNLWYYARRNPVKAFFAVIVPLLSAGGAIGGLMRQFGVRSPMRSGMGGGARRDGGGYYDSRGYERGQGGGMGGGMGGGLMQNAGSLMQIARAFM